MIFEKVSGIDDAFPKMRSGYWNGITRAYKETSPQMLWRIHSDAVNTKLIVRWLPDGSVGCVLKTDMFDEAFSDGLYPLLASKAKKLIGMDMSTSIVYLARARYGDLQSLGADTRRLPFADASFDIIISNSTLDHFESQAEIIISLHELHRVIRTGGQLILTLDNPANPIIKLRGALSIQFLNRLGVVPYYVGASFDSNRLRRTLVQVGFDILEVDAVMHCPRILAVAVSHTLEKSTGHEIQKRFLRFLMAFEVLSRWPTRFLTGHFVAIKAIKR